MKGIPSGEGDLSMIRENLLTFKIVFFKVLMISLGGEKNDKGKL